MDHIECICGHNELEHGFSEIGEWVCDLCDCEEFIIEEDMV